MTDNDGLNIDEYGIFLFSIGMIDRAISDIRHCSPDSLEYQDAINLTSTLV